MFLTSTQWKKEPYGNFIAAAGISQGFISARPCGLNYPSLVLVADRLSIATDRTFFEKVHFFEREVLAALAAGGSTRCTADKEAACREMYGRYFEWTCKKCPENKAGVRDGK